MLLLYVSARCEQMSAQLCFHRLMVSSHTLLQSHFVLFLLTAFNNKWHSISYKVKKRIFKNIFIQEIFCVLFTFKFILSFVDSLYCRFYFSRLRVVYSFDSKRRGLSLLLTLVKRILRDSVYAITFFVSKRKKKCEQWRELRWCTIFVFTSFSEFSCFFHDIVCLFTCICVQCILLFVYFHNCLEKNN